MPTKKSKAKPRDPTRKSAVVRERERFAGTDPDAILSRAMLVNVCIGNWDGRKHDREVTAEVNEMHHAGPEAGRYHKHLFGGKIKELSAVITASTMLRHEHYAQTLPWTDSGWRLLPTKNHQKYTEAIRARIRRYCEAADAFVAVYPRLIREAEARLNGMFRASDYPSAAALRGKFHAEIDWSPISAGSDFRVTLPQDELAQMAKNVEDRLHDSVAAAVKEAWKRLGDAVNDLKEKLSDGKYLRDSLIDRLREVADVLGRLNLTDDPNLEAMRARVIAELTVFSADTIKEQPEVRLAAARSADDILKAMAGVYAPGVKWRDDGKENLPSKEAEP